MTSDSMDAAKLAERRRKYLSLGLGEIVAAVMFALTAHIFIGPRLPQSQDQLALWSALTPLLFVLLVAGTYWLLARRWLGRRAMPGSVAKVLRVARAGSVALLALGAVGLAVWWPGEASPAVLAVGVWVLAAVEFTNYFVVRLSYPAQHWFSRVGEWRTPRLMQDVRRAEGQ